MEKNSIGAVVSEINMLTAVKYEQPWLKGQH